MLSKVRQAQKVKGYLFSLMWKLDLYIYLDTYMYIYTCIYSERENEILLVSLSEGTIGGKRGKENFRE
jgi:hypothetical protein